MSAGRHSRRAARALRRLSEEDPALGALALWCAHRDGEEDADPAPAAWTRGSTIVYGPGFERLASHEQTGLAAHHVLHVALRHAARSRALGLRFAEDYDPELFNLAADALVNQMLVLAGHALPRPAVLLDDLLAAALGAREAADEAVARFDAESLYVRLLREARADTRGRRTERPGDGAGDAPAERARAYARASGFVADLRAEGGPAAGEAPADAAEEAAWRQRLAQALAAGQASGRGLGALGHRLADLPESRTPWETLLRRLVARAVMPFPEIAPCRPARRWIAREADARRAGSPVPGFEPLVLRDRRVPRIAVGIDASGSVDAPTLALFAAQIAGIGRRSGAELHLLVFDEAVRAQHRLRGGDWEREVRALDFARGGGTSFVEVIDRAAALAPSVIVLLTDLVGPVGPQPGRIPVIWAVPGAPPPGGPPFGRVVRLDG